MILPTRIDPGAGGVRAMHVQGSSTVCAAEPPVVKGDACTLSGPVDAAPVQPASTPAQVVSTTSVALSLAPPLAATVLSSVEPPSPRPQEIEGGIEARSPSSRVVMRGRPTFNVYRLVRDFYLGEMLGCCAQNRAPSPSVDRWRDDLAEAREVYLKQTVPMVADYLFDVVVHEMWSGSRFDGTWHQQAPDWCRKILAENHDDKRDYTVLKEAIVAQNFTVAKFGQVARDFFLMPGWREKYGGEPWARIADILGSLEPAEASVWLDRVFGTEHNTNSVFNKGGTGLAEIDRPDPALRALLDYKRDFNDPHAFSKLAAASLEERDRSAFTRLLGRAEVLHLTA